jgi:hypothetical protein
VVNAECEKPSNKVMLYSKKRVKKYKYHVFFVTIQDSVDELGIHFLISIIFCLDMTTWNYSTRKTSCYLKYDWSQIIGLYLNEEKNI